MMNFFMDTMERVVDFIDKTLPYIIMPLAALGILRAFYQMITY